MRDHGLASVWADARYALRTFAKTPAFTAVVVITLALGIGATTAIFSVVDGVLLRPFPYADTGRIMMLNETVRGGQALSIAWPNYVDWREQNTVFESLGIYRGMAVTLTNNGGPAERLDASLVAADVFRTLGVAPIAGRTFAAADDRPGTDAIAIVSERFWRSHFNGDRALVGRSITLDGEPHVVVGIMPAAMRFPSRQTDVWLPLGRFAGTLPADRGRHPALFAVGKLKPGVTVAAASAHMDAIARRLEQAFPLTNGDHTVAVTPYYDQVVGNIRPALVALVVAVGFVLLIACANLANLMLARADVRQREIAVRAALGASRRRILQQVLVESLLVAIVGGALGALVAAWGVRAFVATQPASIPRIDLVSVDLRVLAFTTVVAVLTGLASGFAPAIHSSSIDLLTALKDAVRGSRGTGGARLRSGLVVAEVGLALILLAGAGLTIKSFSRLTAIDPGFDPSNVVVMKIALPAAAYPDKSRWMGFYEDVVRRAAILPGVDAVAVNDSVPFDGGGSESEVIYEGQPPPASPSEEGTMCRFHASTPDYFRAMGIGIVRGRGFTDRDRAGSLPVAVVDEALVSRFFPDQDPIGKRIAFEFRGRTPQDPQPIWREIVGVVRHVRYYGLVGEPRHVQVYAPFAQLPIWFEERPPSMSLLVRGWLPPETLVASVRQAVVDVDRSIPVYGVQTLQTALARTTEQPRLSVIVLAAFAAVALALAAVGIYGVLSYLVERRTQEIGIRVALGATRRDVLQLVVGHGMRLAAAGVAAGLLGAFALTRAMQTLLYGVSPHDPATFTAIAVILCAVAFLASYLPGRRAARVDPMNALRCE